ncbi:transcription factor grauzone-like [Culex pipiens pallens]|uniref:transcription factor grauzone-like n=1 Tax=Culex pipiens pallens TaxID=42434 RepID=UPI001952EEB4|nr:transcription factor grauzone-like [Culex pipiens pallens]
MQLNDCCLCLNTFTDSSLSIDKPDLKSQMDKVFYFSVELDEGQLRNVCHNCSHKIAEFYDYSEKVRVNLGKLSGSVSIEDIKIEPAELDIGEEANVEDSVDVKEELLDSDKEELIAEAPPPVKKPKKKLINIKPKEQLAEENKKLNEFFQMRCDMCEETAESFNALKSHFRSNHGRHGYIMCCKKKLSKRTHLLEHREWHLNPKAFRCELCNKNYKNKFFLSVHQLKVHGTDEDRPFKCDQCPQSYVKSYQLRLHLESHKKVECPICHRVLANKTTLSSHMTNAHSDVDRRMICETCGQGFLSKTTFERHVKAHAGIEVIQRVQCQICQKWLRGEIVLSRHIAYVHGDPGQMHVSCDVCQQVYPSPRALASHKRTVHVPERFECEFCDKKFKQQVNLREHRTQHTGERLYACEHCDATMNSRAHFAVHIKKHHPVEWAAKKQDVGG